MADSDLELAPEAGGKDRHEQASRLSHFLVRERPILIVNSDIDGLLSAVAVNAHLHNIGERPLPVGGYYDCQKLWLSPATEQHVRRSLRSVLWLDVDMRLPGSACISQHYLAARPPGVSIINPNLLASATGRTYAAKYPFSTFAFIWWLLRSWPVKGLADANPREVVRGGLAWMPDGGYDSLRGRYRGNLHEWATRLMPDGPLSVLMSNLPAGSTPRLIDTAPLGQVILAEEALRRLEHNEPFSLTSAAGGF